MKQSLRLHGGEHLPLATNLHRCVHGEDASAVPSSSWQRCQAAGGKASFSNTAWSWLRPWHSSPAPGREGAAGALQNTSAYNDRLMKMTGIASAASLQVLPQKGGVQNMGRICLVCLPLRAGRGGTTLV